TSTYTDSQERAYITPVDRRDRRLVDERALVLTHEVDRVDRAGGREVGDELVGPVARRVELEAEVLVGPEPPANLVGRGRIGEAPRGDERHGPRLAVDGGHERPGGLAEREIEGCACE